MNIAELPETIRTLVEQMSLSGPGVLAHVGATDLLFKCRRSVGECRSRFVSKVITGAFVKYDVGLQFSVNAKEGESWKMVIVYEPDDTYTAYLWRRPAGEPGGSVVESSRYLFWESLQEAVEGMYDRAVEKFGPVFVE